MFGANTLYATYLSGGNIASNTVLTITSNVWITSNSILSVGNSSMNIISGFLASNSSLLEGYGNQNNFIEFMLTNSNTGSNASSDFAIYDTAGIAGGKYVDLGISGSGYSNSNWTIGGASDAYLYTSNSNLSIGVASNNYINFFANGTLSTNEVVRITSGANVGIGNTNPNAKLQVTGTANVSGNVNFGGSANIVGNAFIGGYANVAGYANITGNTYIGGNVYINGVANVIGNSTFSANLTVIGNLTAPTIVTNTSIAGVMAVNSASVNVSVNAYFQNNLTIIGNLNVSGNIIFNGIATGDVLPPGSGYGLGNTTAYWSLYANTIYISNTSATISNTYSYVSTANAIIDRFAIATYRSAEYLIQASNSTAYQVSKVLVVHDGTTAYATEYAIVNSAAQMLTLGVTRNNANVELWSIPSSSAVVVKFTRTNLVV
jgi:hypothetical protein